MFKLYVEEFAFDVAMFTVYSTYGAYNSTKAALFSTLHGVVSTLRARNVEMCS